MKAINMDSVWTAKRTKKVPFGMCCEKDYIEITGLRTKDSKNPIIFRMKEEHFLYVVDTIKTNIRRAKEKADRDFEAFNEAIR